MRLDKFLVETGVGSRSQVKSLLKKKAILVNQEVETSPKVQINEHKDVVTYLGKPLTYEAFVYYILNKPAGFLSATKDRAQATVIDLLDETARQKDVFPVGSEMAIQHLAASTIGQAVTIVITALKEEGRKYDFRIEAFVGDQLIGKACHTRVRVDSRDFMEKVTD